MPISSARSNASSAPFSTAAEIVSPSRRGRLFAASDAFAHSQVVRRHFHQLIDIDELDTTVPGERNISPRS
jgi:hypothetical protein